MATTPTANAVPSNAAEDLLFNAEKLDEAINSSALEYVDRRGVSRKTLSGAVASISSTNNRGAWATLTAYLALDIVSNAGTWYICVFAHTAGATFVGDAAYWRVYQGVLASDLADTAGSSNAGSMIGWLRNAVGAVATNIKKLLGWHRPILFEFMTSTQVTQYQDGVTSPNITSAVQAAEAARVAGDWLEFPPGRFTIDADVSVTKAGGWDLRGVTVDADDAVLFVSTSDFELQGNRSAEWRYTTGGTPGNNRAIRVIGAMAGPFGIASGISVGATSFAASSAGDAAPFAAGDWALVVDHDVTNDILSEFHQVLSVAGATVNLTTPVLQAFNTFTQQFYRITTPRKNVRIDQLKITSTSTGTACIGVDAQVGVIDFELTDCVFDVKNGLPWNVYSAHNAHIDRNVVKQMVGQKAAVSQVHGGSVSLNKFWAQDAAPNNGALLLETGTCFMHVDGNKAYGGAGGTGAFTFNYVTKCTITGNLAAGDGTTIGFDLAGARDNIFNGNHAVNVAQGVRVVSDAVPTPDYTSIKNIIANTTIRNATTGINIGAGCTGNTVIGTEADSSVTTAIADAGSGNIIVYRDQTDNTNFTLSMAKFDKAVITKRVTLTWAANIVTDASLGNTFFLAAIDANNRTFDAPTNAKSGERIRYYVSNTSGGALGTLSWNAIFKMAAWVNPANGSYRWIEFEYNGTNWQEGGRATADLPN